MNRLGSLHGIDRDALIESGEVSIALHRERQKVDIGQLPVTFDTLQPKPSNVAQGNGVFPKVVIFALAESREAARGILDRRSAARVLRVRDDSDQTVFSQRARGPIRRARFCKPVVGCLVVDVACVEKSDEYVDIEESRQSGPQGSSSNRSTSSELPGRESSQGGSNGTPFLTVLPSLSRRRARRANSDNTLPAVVLRSAASSLVAFSTSSSISRVVRMTEAIVAHHASDAR